MRRSRYGVAFEPERRRSTFVGEVLDVGAMFHEIDGERQAEPHRFRRERVLALKRAAIAGDVVGGHRVESWIETWTWSRPASQRSRKVRVVMPTPEVMRLVRARLGHGARDVDEESRRAPGSPPERCTCMTPSAAASVKTRTRWRRQGRPLAPVERRGGLNNTDSPRRAPMRQLGEQA